MAFGEEIAMNVGGRTTANKYGQSDSVRQRFTGYQKDDETGLDFAEARYYNGNHGRFTAVDPLLASGKSTNPQTFNRYVYSMNRPLIMTDPTGMQAGTQPKPKDNFVGQPYQDKTDKNIFWTRPGTNRTIFTGSAQTTDNGSVFNIIGSGKNKGIYLAPEKPTQNSSDVEPVTDAIIEKEFLKESDKTGSTSFNAGLGPVTVGADVSNPSLNDPSSPTEVSPTVTIGATFPFYSMSRISGTTPPSPGFSFTGGGCGIASCRGFTLNLGNFTSSPLQNFGQINRTMGFGTPSVGVGIQITAPPVVLSGSTTEDTQRNPGNPNRTLPPYFNPVGRNPYE